MAVRLTENTQYNHNNSAIHQNERAQSRREARKNQAKGIKLRNNSINLGGLKGGMDSVLHRKQLARKKALKFISDAWAGDKKIDQDLDKQREHRKSVQAERQEYESLVRACREKKASLKEEYGVADDSQEQQDLEFLEMVDERRRFPAIPKPDGEEALQEGEEPEDPMERLRRESLGLSKDEYARLKDLESKPLTDYQRRCRELDADMEIFSRRAEAKEAEEAGIVSSIRDMRVERLKHHGMEEAQKEAEEINAAASKEVIGMLIGEAQDHVDETLEEKWEAAKEKAEEKEEQEEKLEESKKEKEQQQEQLELKRQENKEKQESRTEKKKEAREQADFLKDVQERYVNPVSSNSQVKTEIKHMLQQMKLLGEDIKGVKVDEEI